MRVNSSWGSHNSKLRTTLLIDFDFCLPSAWNKLLTARFVELPSAVQICPQSLLKIPGGLLDQTEPCSSATFKYAVEYDYCFAVIEKS